MRILIIDPDEYYHKQFQDSFADLGELVLSTNHSDAMAAARQTAPDVLITELLVSDTSAFDVAREMRSEPSNMRMPVIIYSKTAHREDIESALDSGVMGYFVKGQDSINDIKRLLLNYN